MKIAIVGFPGSGKSACFKAITQKTKDEVDALDPTKPHLGVVKILDPRLDALKKIFNPKKITYAEITLEDLPGFHIPHIKEVEALMEVVGVFSGRDPAKDIEDMDIEFMLADTEIINHRLPALEKELKQDRSRERMLEQEVLTKCKGCLEQNRPLRDLKLAQDEEKSIRGFQFLSSKPIFVLCNVEEGKGSDDASMGFKNICEHKGLTWVQFCAELEAEIADLDASERGDFLKELGIKDTVREKVVELAYKVLGYITFFTTKSGETKAWPVKVGTPAIEAAGKIHSDIKKGFIKAEVINFNELVSCGSLQEARKKALLRLEGKEYIVQEGDIIDFKFNV